MRHHAASHGAPVPQGALPARAPSPAASRGRLGGWRDGPDRPAGRPQRGARPDGAIARQNPDQGVNARAADALSEPGAYQDGIEAYVFTYPLEAEL